MADKTVNLLIRRLRKQGFFVQTHGCAHPKVYRDGRFLGPIPKTPSEYRSMKNAILRLRRHGYVDKSC